MYEHRRKPKKSICNDNNALACLSVFLHLFCTSFIHEMFISNPDIDLKTQFSNELK